MAITIREYLGDEKIAQLESMGFLPSLSTDMAKRQYAADKQAKRKELSDVGLDGKLVQSVMRGDINEEEAKNAQKFEEFGSKKHGFALGAAKTVTGIANTVERVGDFINPFYEGKHDKDENYIYQNGLEKSLRPKIKNVEKMRDDYEKATGETSWGSRLAEIGTEMVGDPINFVGGVGLLSKGSKLAQFGKKTLYFAGTGAASGGVAALGEGKNDEETLKNIGYGAAGGFVLGHAIDQGIQGISKLIAKRQASKMANEADAIESAENSEFLGGERAEINTAEITARKDEPLLHAERSQRDYATKGSPAQIMTAKEFATKEVGLDEDTATNVLKEAMQGKEKSEFIDADSYNDIVKFKNFEVQREYAKAYDEKIQTAQASINNAREQSAIRYADTQKAISEYQKQGMSPSAIRELINAKFKPSADEIDYTRAYNDGADVDARLAGQGIFYALEKDIAAQAYTPEIYATRLKQRGFSDESVQAFTQAYANKDIDIAKEYVNKKVADAYESRIQREVADEINSENRININKDGAYSGHPMLHPDEPSIGQGDLKGNLINETTKQEDLSSLRAKIEQENNIVPIKEFGTNYAEFYHDGKGAIDKLLTERDGQVAGAFYRKELGDIDLVWGNENFGLAHILKRRSEQWGEEKAIKFLSHLDENIKNGDISQAQNKRVAIKTNKTTIILDNMGENKFVLSAYRDRSNAKSENAKFVQSSDIISKDIEANAKDSSVLLPTDDHIISQKGNLINEEAKNSALPNGVSGIGDNASGARGRQGGDEEILRQSGRNTSSASQTKQTAKSDEQMEQRSAFKTDGDTDATASSKQMVEEQGSSASIGSELRVNSNAHLGSGLVAGTLNSIDEDGNFNPDRFTAGFLAGLAGSKAVAIAARKMTPQLYNKILGTAKKMPQMAKDNPKLLGKLYANGKDVSLNSFAGEKAITANVGKLDQAKAMLEKGADEVEIWQKTGWFKDKDGAWKFEIGDSKARLNPNFKSGGRLGELLEHEELFKAYPELKDVGVVKIEDEIPSGAAQSVKNVAQREKRGIYNVAFNNKKSTIIRKDLETIDEIIKFEKGEADYIANGEHKSGYGALHIKKHLEAQNNGWVSKQEYLNMGQMLRKSTMQEADNKRIYTYFNDDGVRFRVVVAIGKNKERVISFYSNRKPLKAGLSYNSQNYDGNLPLNDDIIAQNGTKGYYSPANNEIGLSDLSDKSTLMHEVQHAIQEIEGFAKGSGAKGENYRLSHGEAEARNVQNRLNLGDKFRVKIVKDNNQVGDDYHTWIRDESDIKTFKQAYNDDGGGDLTPDFTEAMAKKAIDSGEITVYSSKPIKAGNFVTPSKMEAKSYAGSGKIYEEKLNLNDISWIDALQGQVTRNKDIHPHETFDVNPNETFVSRENGVNLSHELEKKYILKDGSINEAAVRKEAEPFIEKEYSLENFKAEFPNGKVDTPIGEVAVSNYQFEKLNFKGREKYLGLIKPTLERPAFVVDFEDTTFFFKPFRDKDGIVKFASVIKERDGGLDVTSNYPMANRKFELITREGKVRYVQGSVAKPVEHSLDNNVRSSATKSPIEHSSDSKGIIPQNEEKVYHSRNIEEIKQEHPNVEKELDESIAAMKKESFNDVNFKDDLISKINAKDITTKQLGKSVDLSDKQLAVLKNDIKNADFKVISDSKIYFDKMGKDGDKKRFFIDIAEDGKVRVDGYSKKDIDTIPVRQSALEELAGVGDRARLKNMSFEVKAAYFNELDPIKKEAILKTAELNKLKKAAQSGDKLAVAKFEEFKARNLDENGNIKDGLSLC
ncbi:hypothetical protein UNSWCS_267 [Campylobacter concisus UNSWCS]|uniref:Uncharacterized protein n=1 Tax=Campylobacter concisus UNSWCS TaxID=1242968 RepID=U2F111_9BACT|nr:LPD23 domain-containing protein [Campylobacter concisus]ERJ30166.1 hypothetical protein UNSWCS_267 [Campylobacter concisus UNSWCS]